MPLSALLFYFSIALGTYLHSLSLPLERKLQKSKELSLLYSLLSLPHLRVLNNYVTRCLTNLSSTCA